MTLAEVKALRDKYYAAMLAETPIQVTHSIGDASYSWDEHRSSLMDAFKYWDNLYNVKLSAGMSQRLGKKAV